MNIRKLFFITAMSAGVLSSCNQLGEQASTTPAQPQTETAQHTGDMTMAANELDAHKIAVVEEMITAWNEKEWNKIADLFTEDGVLHSMMIDPINGREAIRKRINNMGEGLSEITLNIRNIGVINDAVFIERTDEFVYNGHAGKVPVVGVLIVEGDLVKEWREYYDRAELLEEMGLEEDFG
ncbi:SgcJ/EcaC family oxidoreductase [Algimonas arctica]|nr:SgcJ/EcaC family oxidoreductase [Algimonas arctica]